MGNAQGGLESATLAKTELARSTHVPSSSGWQPHQDLDPTGASGTSGCAAAGAHLPAALSVQAFSGHAGCSPGHGGRGGLRDGNYRGSRSSRGGSGYRLRHAGRPAGPDRQRPARFAGAAAGSHRTSHPHGQRLPPGREQQRGGGLQCRRELPDPALRRAATQVGTLGGGNHFIELCLDPEDNVWILLHSGSRFIGKTVADCTSGRPNNGRGSRRSSWKTPTWRT